MNADSFARRCLVRVQYGDSSRRPFELPTPTLEDVIDLLHDLRARVWDYRFWLDGDSRMSPSDYMIAARDRLSELEATLEAIRTEHGIPEAEWNALVGETPPRDERPDELRAVRNRISRWQPQVMGAASNGVTVFTITGDEGRSIWLTFEDGQWWQHDGYPYAAYAH